MISLRTAVLLYALLAAISLATLKGKALAFALVLIGALLAKSLLYQYKSRL